MKRTIPVLICLLFALTVLLPTGTLISACFGYYFVLTSVPAFAITTSIISVCTAILSCIFHCSLENQTIRVLTALIAPLSFINSAFYLFECNQPSVIISVFVSTVCCCILAVQHGKPLALKIAALASAMLMILPLGFFCFLAILFGDFSSNTVVQTVESPNGEYYAQLIANDQGALGGSTIVEVCQNHKINLVLFKTEKKPRRVYVGDWGTFESMEIYWKDNHHLMIGSTEYEID